MARYALVIGIARYKNLAPNLPKAAMDAEAVARVLEQHGDFYKVERLPRRWLQEEQRYEVADKLVTADEVFEALKNFLNEAENQEAFIYFAGHGFRVFSRAGKQRGFLATSDSRADGQNAIALDDDFNILISQSNLSSLVVLLDCCHAGALLESHLELNRNLIKPSLSAFNAPRDYYLITACRAGELAREGGEHGVFTGAVLQGLSQENANPVTGRVSTNRLFDSIYQQLQGSGQEPFQLGGGRSITLVTHKLLQNVGTSAPASSPVKWKITFSATGDDANMSRVEAIVAHLRRLTRDVDLTLVRAEPGFKSLILESSREGYRQIEEMSRTGQLAQELFGTSEQGTQVDEICPYQGLEAFEREHAQFFFGRKQVIEDICKTLNQSNFVAVIGASGSGKSSTVRAGVIPQLEKSGWQVLKPMTPGTAPLAKLVTVFEPLFEGIRNQKQLDAFIYTDPEGLQRLIEHLPSSQRFLLLVDQFEEVFTLSRPDDRNRFIDLLTQAARLSQSQLAVVTTMRADFLEPCLKYSALTQLIQDYPILMKPLTPAELQQAIEEPAKKQGYSLESGLLGEILQEVRQEPGCLPLLQFALRQLWERRDRENHQLTCSAYQEIGGAIGALNRHAEELYQKLSKEEQGWVKIVCLKLTRTGEEEKDSRQRQSKQELLKLAPDPHSQQVLNTVLTALVDERLSVTGKEDSGEAWVDLAHEALMEGWQQFAQWRKEDRELRRLCDRVEDYLRDWLEHEQNKDYLISGGMLVQVTNRWAELKPYLQTTAQEFYQRSYDREREKTSYEPYVSQFKDRLQELQTKLSERLQEEENDESKLIKLRKEIEDFLGRTQQFEQRIHLAHLAANWLRDNQETLVESIVQYSLAKNPHLMSDAELVDSPEKVQKFYEDINKYVDWLRDSLILGEPIQARLQFPLAFPKSVYIDAFDFLDRERLINGLSEDAKKELQLYLDYLINHFIIL